MHAVVPLKAFAQAKQRLAGVLSPQERVNLARAMARDVLRALRATPALDGIVLVSREPEAAALARAFGIEHFREPAAADLSQAVQCAGEHLLSGRIATGMLIVPADVPRITPDDVNAVLQGHDTLTLVPDRAGVGTNCIVSTPPNRIRYRFDGRSFEPHVAAARAGGIEPRIAHNANLGLDVDTADDLLRLLHDERDTETNRLLLAGGIARRLARTPPVVAHA